MAPDADKLRQRKAMAIQANADEAVTLERVSTLKGIKPHELAIDGVIYDISNFNHPGGESIKVFGGNDVTVQYKMIHAYHTSKHMEKMKRVGTVSDYACDYKFDTPFEKEVKQEVFKIVRRGKEFGTWGWHFRALFYTLAMFYLQYLWAFQGSSFWLAIAYGVSQSLIGLNVQHDANHGASSKNHIFNDVYGLGADFIGGSKWLWMEQHWTHHTYTNDVDRDPDALGAEPFMLFHNYPLGHPARKWVHRFQAFFYMLVLSGYWISSVFNPEILDLKQRGALGRGLEMESDYIKDRRKYAIAMRVYYIFVNAIVPFFYHNWLTAFGHVMLMGASESLFLSVLFSLSHNFVVADRDPTKATKETGEPVCWFKSQVETSCTYGGFVAGCVTGGLNFQIEHHLFPRMSSAWYPFIAPTVRQVCKKHGVHYEYYPWVWQNWFSTMRYMNAAGTGAWWKNGLRGNPLRGDL